MTVCHHPENDLLLSYAAGSLAESWSLAIASHLEHCAICRRDMELAEHVGGVLLQAIPSEKMSANALDHILAEIEGLAQEAPRLPPRTASGPAPVLPKPLRDYIGGDVDAVPWQRLGNDAYHYLIETGDSEAQARLLRIKAGKPVPSHGHGGRELTLVLAGRFDDELSSFGPGDMEDVAEETVHKPVAAPGEDCICLAVTDAPLKFKEFLPRLLQPILKI
jgi:putative transcriptional regulator